MKQAFSRQLSWKLPCGESRESRVTQASVPQLLSVFLSSAFFFFFDSLPSSSILWVSWKLLEPWRGLALSSGKLFSGFNLHVFGSSNCQLPLKQVIVRSISLREHLLFLNHRMRVVSSAERNRCFSSYCLPNVGRKFK